MPAVDSKHPEYIDNYDKWELMHNILKGDVKQYIWPIVDEKGKPIKDDPGYYKRCRERNEKYRDLARFLNFTLQTTNGLIGVAMSKPGVIELPSELEYLLEEASGNKLKLDQLIQKLIRHLLTRGRAGCYVDYPAIAQGLTEADRKAKNINPRMYFYESTAIFNWDTEDKDGTEVNSFWVLHEPHWKRVDGFKWECEHRYRVLELTDDLGTEEKIFKVSVVDKTGTLIALENGGENPTYPKKNGKYWDRIPFYIFGATDNNSSVDYGPLQPIAHINIGHYRNSAGYEDNLETHGQSTAVITSSLNRSDWQQIYQGRPIKMGSKEAYYLGESGDIKLVQCEPAPELANAMQSKIEQMIALGAYVMLPTSANAPVETTRLHASSKTSILGTIVSNVEDGVLQLIKWCGEYKGLSDSVINSIVFALNYDFIPENADPAVMRELAAQWVQGLIPKSVVLNYNRKADLIPDSVSDEELEEELRAEDPIRLTLPDNNTNNTSNNDGNSQEGE